MYFDKLLNQWGNRNKEKSKSVTIVTITYNAEEVLEETILSITGQSYDHIEYIIIDGASSDGTIDIIRKYEDNIDYWISEPDKGIYFAMNKAIERATGEWINFMNAGDSFVDDQVISTVMNEDIKNFDLIYGATFVVDGKNKRLAPAAKNEDLLLYPAINHQSLFARAKILKKYSFNTSYKICADYDFELKCESNGYKFKRLDYPIANFLAGGLNSKEIYRTRIEGISILLKYKDIATAKKSRMSQRLISDGQAEMHKNQKKNKSLLITGTHRSGSTWIGKVIEKSNQFVYLEEPTSLNDIPGSLPSINYWFQYIQNSDEAMIKDLLTLNQNALSQNKRALFKDPLAFFSIDAFMDKLEADVLISVRHPAAFVSSLKRLGWSHDFNHFLEQKELMETYLYPFRNEIKDFAKKEKDIIDQGILLWNIINLSVLKFKQKYPQIYTIRHEDLSINPIIEFQKIFDYLGISFAPEVKQYLLDTTSKDNDAEAQNNVTHQLHRDSKANIFNFKNRLAEEEIARIRRGTEMISHVFYDQEWWDI